jgi:hypothetical protein
MCDCFTYPTENGAAMRPGSSAGPRRRRGAAAEGDRPACTLDLIRGKAGDTAVAGKAIAAECRVRSRVRAFQGPGRPSGRQPREIQLEKPPPRRTIDTLDLAAALSE